MSLKDAIQRIAQETAVQTVGAIVGQLVTNNSSVGTIVGSSTDANGNRTLSVNIGGTTVSGIFLASNRPLGVGDTVSIVGTAGNQIAQ